MRARDQVFFEYAPIYSPERRERFRQQLDQIEADARAQARREDAAFLLNEERPKHASRAIFCDGITHVADLLLERANNGSEAAR